MVGEMTGAMVGEMTGEMTVRRVVVRVVVVDAPSGVMIDVMIARQEAVDARSANLPMVIAVRRDQPVAAVLKVVVVQTVMTAQPAVASHHSVTSQPAAASHHSVTSQPAAASHLAASPPSTNVRILVTNRRRQSHRQIATMLAQNAHHQPRKSASVQHGQAVMPHRRAARAR